ncbi:MAG: HEPN domain-containing protein [Ruminococcus flavefaciens]|nr:HEPN domain-containing protein [Ruminococcus flavefaciens]
MLDEDLQNLSYARLAHANDCLEEAGTLLKQEQYKGAANRSYYAAFHALRAVLILNGFDSKKHSGIIAKFRELYLKSEIFDKKMSDAITSLFRVRQASNYDDFYVIMKNEAIEQFENAENIIKTITEYLKNK